MSEKHRLLPVLKRLAYFGRAPFALTLLLAVFVVLDGLAVFGPDAIRNVGPLVAGLGTFWQPVVIAAWLVKGKTRWALRWPVSVVGMGLLGTTKLFATRGRNGVFEFESEVILVAILLAQFLIPPAVSMFVWWRERHTATPQVRPWQFSLRQLLIWITGISMAAALARALLLLPHSSNHRLSLTELAVSCGVVFVNAMLIAYFTACANTPQRSTPFGYVGALRFVVSGIVLSALAVLVAATIPMLLCAGPFCFLLQAVSALAALALVQDIGWRIFAE